MHVKSQQKALLFDIQRFSIHDGPGIRTLLFFKGCTLNCAWCQNPESINSVPEIAFYRDRCIGCEDCERACPNQSIDNSNPDKLDRSTCDVCGECAAVCPAKALCLVGELWSVSELITICLQDKAFYDSSSGGITLSGGEPVLQTSFLQTLLPEMKKHDLNVLLETAGNYAFSRIEPLLPFIDEIYFDLKLPTSDSYRKYTGSSNDAILKNLKQLKSLGIPLTVRIPVLPGINTSEEQIRKLCDVIVSHGFNEVALLEYNSFWQAKIPRLGKHSDFDVASAGGFNYKSVLETFKMRLNVISSPWESQGNSSDEFNT